LLYQATRILITSLLRLFTRVEIIDRENFPSPPYIAAINHLSYFDSPLLLTACPHRIRAFAAAKYKGNVIFGPLLRAMGAIWVERGKVDRRALRQALKVLDRSEVLGLAPEGTRSTKTHSLQRGKTGITYIATRADVPIVPIGLTGTEYVLGELRRLRRPKIRAVVGQPFHLPKSGRVPSEELREYADLVMTRIAELLPPSYRGVYAGDV